MYKTITLPRAKSREKNNYWWDNYEMPQFCNKKKVTKVPWGGKSCNSFTHDRVEQILYSINDR